MSVRIRELTHQSQAWDAFVRSHPDGTFFHLAAWKTVLESAFGHRTHYIYAERDGAVVGVLPLAEVKSLLFGHHLSSTPFCVYGGPVAVDAEAAAALVDEARRRAEALRVEDLELRNLRPLSGDWEEKDLYATFRKTISDDVETNLKAIPRKQRAMVRKGIKAGLESEEDPDPAVARFYRVYSESVRNLGTPVFSRRYFRILKETFGRDCRVLMVRHGEEDIAGVMSFYFRDQVLPYYGGSRPAARRLKGNDFMYWELMRRSAGEGIRFFDFGRSKKNTGAYSFKKNWGFEPEPLHYQYHLVRAQSVPEVNPNNPKYQRFIRAWKRLPLPVANTLGPLLAKHLG